MADKLVNRDFVRSLHFLPNDHVCFGTIPGITDLVTYQGDNVDACKQVFEESVDDYIALCKKPERQYLSLSKDHLTFARSQSHEKKLLSMLFL